MEEISQVSEAAVQLKPEYIVGLSVLATVGIVAMRGMFWHSVAKSQENIMDILRSPSFFKTVTVIGVIAETNGHKLLYPDLGRYWLHEPRTAQ